MLVLSRRQNQGIVIEVPPSTNTTTIRLVVVESSGGLTRFGLEAPREVNICRDEVPLRPKNPKHFLSGSSAFKNQGATHESE